MCEGGEMEGWKVGELEKWKVARVEWWENGMMN